jgi:eukaryotic-like serine/threonine-protein kinase
VSDEGRLIAGRYRLTEQIGRGGMGTVWRAEDEVLGRQIALKRLHTQPHLSADELLTLYERMRREARSAARVTHPNVIVVHDVVDDEGRPCIVMEYVPGSTLADFLQGGATVPPGEAARIGLGMVAALRAAHAAGVLHRDVKPGNVLLGAHDRVVLTDFGIAMTDGTSTLTKTGEMVGSIDYMAPERIRGQQPGPASDLWALGASLYQAVEGRPPFRRETAMETAYAIAVDALKPMKQAGPLEPLIELLLAKNPDERPSAEQTERALRAARAGERTAVLSSMPAATDPSTSAGTDRYAPPGPTATHAPAATGRHGRTSGTSGTHPRTTPGGLPEPPAPDGTGGHDRGRGRGRRKRKGRKIAVAVATTAALAAGATLYVTTQHASDTPAREHGQARTTPPASSPSPVPEGYHLVKEAQLGVSFPLPNGWKLSKRSTDEVKYTDPTRLAGITIGTVDPAGPNPVTHFTDIETNTKANYPTYRRLRMQRTTFRGQPAAVWEFTFKGRARVFRAIDLGFGREGEREYDIYLSAPEADWGTYRPIFDQVRDGFTTPES